MTRKIGFIVGSLREGSYNRKTAETFEKLFEKHATVGYLEIGQLPFYNEDLETKENTPDTWTAFRQEAAKYDAFVFFTPEYNRSVPAVLKNAIDVGSRPYGASIWDGKPALVVSVSIGAISGFGANHHLRQSLTFVNMPTLQQPEAYVGNVTQLLEATGEFPENTIGFFQSITDAFLDFTDKLVK
ncbi:NADPH-dependent FMN reductase [Enterococcus sp. LJL98]